MFLTGTFSRSIDEKCRIAIPKRLRDVLEAKENKGVYLTPGTDGSLVIYTEEAFGRLAERLAQESPTRHDVRAFMRLFFAQAQRVELDGQGRILIPQELVAFAKLDKEVVLLGVQDHVEVWAAERWQAYLGEKQAQYDQLAEGAFHGPGSA